MPDASLAGEDDTEIDLLPIEADAPACGHGDGLVVERTALNTGKAKASLVVESASQAKR